MPARPDLDPLKAALAVADDVIAQAAAHVGSAGGVDANQLVAYDLAHGAAGVAVARAALNYGARGEAEAALACAFVADALFELAAKVLGREAQWGVAPGALDGVLPVVRAYRDPAFVASLAATEGRRHLDRDFEMVQDTFRRFADEQIRPRAAEVHRSNGDVPESVIAGLAEMGCFGLSVPEEYGGFAAGGESDLLAMVIATEELSRASLGAGGSLITRPEILARALVKGGTEDQKRTWLPRIASGEQMVAVAVTEPDFGSDVAGLKVTATPAAGGATGDARGWVVNGVKTWCTFAARAEVVMLLARTDPDRSRAHRGLSLFIVSKPRTDGRGFVVSEGDGRLEGRPIDTIGYRGMHSFELAFDNWWVPEDRLIGGPSGQGRGFYLQMEGFEAGRLQTAARAIGVMQAAYEAAREYAASRVVFGRPVAEYQLTQAKLGRMAALIQAARQHMYEVARLMATGTGPAGPRGHKQGPAGPGGHKQSSVEASMLKAYVCRAAEWVTREAMQIHGGMGYAEEFPVSRYFLDARVLSIFEGADEVLALKVVARRLVEQSTREQ